MARYHIVLVNSLDGNIKDKFISSSNIESANYVARRMADMFWYVQTVEEDKNEKEG